MKKKKKLQFLSISIYCVLLYLIMIPMKCLFSCLFRSKGYYVSLVQKWAIAFTNMNSKVEGSKTIKKKLRGLSKNSLP